MPDVPLSRDTPANPARIAHRALGVDAGRTRSVNPPNVWLCAEPPGLPEPEVPRWARRVIHTLSEPGEPVIIRALRGYPGLAHDVAVLLRVAAATGRRPVALLPTLCLAARTRALLRNPAAGSAAGCAEPDADPMAGGHVAPAGMAERPVAAPPVATGALADTETAAGHRAANGQCPVTADPVATGLAADTNASADTSLTADTGPCADTGRYTGTGTVVATDPSAPAVVRVGVARRRSGVEHGPAAAVIVLAGPVGMGARAPHRALPSARLLSVWARALELGGVIGVLSPPPAGRHRRSERATVGRGVPIPEVGQGGLMWADRIVLVHADTHAAGLGHHAPPRPPQLPFAPTHTYLDLYESDSLDLLGPAGHDDDGDGASR